MSILLSLLSSFRDKPENIATRGLHAVLSSKRALNDFKDFLAINLGWNLPINEIRIQERDGDCQPDLKGIGQANTTIFFGEVKFEADLMDTQPCDYLNLLPGGGLLLFVVPNWRRDEIWQRVRFSLQQNNLLPEGPIGPGLGDYHLIDNQGRHIALVAGADLLTFLLNAAQEAGDVEGICDIRQLQALWTAYDKPDLPPVSEEKLNNSGLADLICGLGRLPRRIATVVNLPNTRLTTSYLRGATAIEPVQVGRIRGWVIYSPENWEKYGYSPIWFETNPHVPGYVPANARLAVRAAFSHLVGPPLDRPRNSVTYIKARAITVPLRILPNHGVHAVVADIVTQLDNLSHLIEHFMNINPGQA